MEWFKRTVWFKMEWLRDVIEKTHPTKDKLLEFLYARDWPYNTQEELIEFVEKNDGTPVNLYSIFPNAWYKILYAISLVIETKSSGTITSYNPNGSPSIIMNYCKGEFVMKG